MLAGRIGLLILTSVWIISCMYGIYQMCTFTSSKDERDKYGVKFNSKIVYITSYLTEALLILGEGTLMVYGLRGEWYSELIPVMAGVFTALGFAELLIAILEDTKKIQLAHAIYSKVAVNAFLIIVLGFTASLDIMYLVKG